MPSFGLYRTWYPHFMATFTINDITCTIFIPSNALYMISHLICMMSHSLCVLHHTMTLSMASNTICLCYIHLIWQQAQCYDHKTFVCLPSHYAWHYTQCIFDIRHNVPIFWKEVNVCHHSYYMYDTICKTYDITSTLYNFTPLKLSHYIHCTHDITHPIYDITHMAIRTIYLPSVPLYLTLHPLYLWNQTQGISYTKPTLCMTSHTVRVTSYSVCMLSQQLFRTLHTSMNNFTTSIFMTSYPVCTLSPYRFCENKTTIPDISPAIFDITATVSVSSHRWHTPLYRCIALLMTSQQVCKPSHLAHVWHHTQSTSHHIHSIEMNDHVLWHHIHGIHDIRSSLYDIISTL